MSEMKKEVRFFSIMDYEKEATYLSERHREGWRFYNVTFPGIYTFEKCEPEYICRSCKNSKNKLVYTSYWNVEEVCANIGRYRMINMMK